MNDLGVPVLSFPYIEIEDKAVRSMNVHFTEFTGYSSEEILNKTPFHVLKQTLKSTCRLCPEGLPDNESICFIFTKNRMAKRVKLISKRDTPSKLMILFIEEYSLVLQDKYCFLEHIIQNSGIGIALFSLPDGILLKANSYFLHYLFENDWADHMGSSLKEIFSHLGDDAYEETVKNLIPIDEPKCFDAIRHDIPGKGTAYWSLTLAPVVEEPFQYVFLVAKEVTEPVLNSIRIAKQSKTIQHKNRQLQAIFNNVSEGLYIIDYENEENPVLINKRAQEFFDSIDVPSTSQKDLQALILYDREGNEIPKEKFPLTRILNGEKYEQCLYTLKKDNKDIHLCMSGTPLYDSDKKLRMALICAQIATERVNREKELQNQKDLYYKIFDMLELPIAYFSYPKMDLYGLNRNASDILTRIYFSMRRETVSIENIKVDNVFFAELKSSIDVDRHQFVQYVNEMERKKDTVMFNFKIFNGKPTTYKLILQPLINTHGEIDELMITGFDITSEIEQRSAIEKIARMKDELIYTITHEFKTPLTVINSAVQAMEFLCRNEMSLKAREYLRKIKQNSYRQLRLVNNLLDVNRISTGKVKVNLRNMDIVNTTRVITESVQIYAQQKGIRLVFSSSMEKRIMGIDDEKYERVLLNLLSNAIKFTPKGKSVYVRVSLRKPHQKLMAQIIIEDEGIGIPTDKYDFIFERFSQVDSSLTRNVEGSGLGLSLVKQLIEALGGSISVESKVGKGSKFTVFLPAVKAKHPAQAWSRIPSNNQLIETTAIEFSDIYFNHLSS